MTDKLHFEKEFKVASYNSDFQSKATIQSLLQYFQEVAWEHAENAGKEIIPVNDQRIRISMGRNGFSGITSCQATAVVNWLQK